MMKKNNLFTKRQVNALKKLEYTSAIEDLLKGESFQEKLGITDDMIDDFYSIATRFLNNKRYVDAADCFLALAILQPLNHEFWLSLGNAETGNLEPENALEAYSMAMLYNADDPYPHLYSAQIYARTGKLEQASQCLNVCFRLIDEDPAMEPIRPPAKNLQKVIAQKRKKG